MVGLPSWVGGCSMVEHTDGWTRWDPSIAKSANWTLSNAVRDFQPLDNEDGEECARWLKEQSLDDYPLTVTWVLCAGGKIEGFFAMCSGVMELELPHSTPNDEVRSVKWPCSVIKWMCRHGGERPGGGEYEGAPIINHAIYRAREVATYQGNVALFIEPSNPVIAQKLLEQHTFLRQAQQGQLDDRQLGQLWVPLFDNHILLYPEES